jgi:hypothetical protein
MVVGFVGAVMAAVVADGKLKQVRHRHATANFQEFLEDSTDQPRTGPVKAED